MNDSNGSRDRNIRTDQWQPPRGSRTVRADNDARHRPQAGEYGEGAAQETTGVGPRRAAAEPQVLNDRPGSPDSYGNVAPGIYGAHGYTGDPGHPSAYAADSGVPGAAGHPGLDDTASPAADTGATADDQLRGLIRERLTEDPEIDASGVTIDVRGGSVTLTGSVSSERTRDVVEQCVQNCGARAVRNQLSIR